MMENKLTGRIRKSWGFLNRMEGFAPPSDPPTRGPVPLNPLIFIGPHEILMHPINRDLFTNKIVLC